MTICSPESHPVDDRVPFAAVGPTVAAAWHTGGFGQRLLVTVQLLLQGVVLCLQCQDLATGERHGTKKTKRDFSSKFGVSAYIN